jgi:hypothetical protein
MSAWITPTLLNSWVHSGAPLNDFQYRFSSDRKLEFRGAIKGGSAGSVALVLPPGMITPNDPSWAVDTGEPTALASSRATLTSSTGEVTITPGSSGAARYPIKVCADDEVPITNLTGSFMFVATAADNLAGKRLTNVNAYVTTASSDGDIYLMLFSSTFGYIFVGGFFSFLTIPNGSLMVSGDESSLIDPAYPAIADGEMIAIQVFTGTTTAKGLGVVLVFS